MSSFSFTLEPIPPFRLDLTAWILRRRPDNQVDRWDGLSYQRILVLNGKPCEISVTQISPPESPILKILVSGTEANPDHKPQVTSTLERLLGIQLDLREFYQLSERVPELKILTAQFRGAKPPRFPTYFEAMLNAIACQQLSLTVGIQLLNRLSNSYGPAFRKENDIWHAFPDPKDLVSVKVEELRELGFSFRKGEYLLGLAQSIVDEQVNLEEVVTLEDQAAIERLCKIRGVGRWTSEYFLLRGLGRTHIFPGDDIGARNNLQRWLNIHERLDYHSVQSVLSEWKEYQGLIYFHLLLKSLFEKGALSQ